MRIQQLHLLRYGKFTDHLLELPAAALDFHFVLGANEAGKSTTRSAILDLLYGIETRSTLDFVHTKADMRLGATLQHGGQELAFVRIKARLKTLQTPAGAALADTALAPFLAGTDRSFFDQMFGLDHTRLQAGGHAILSAHNDLGQILFQSAAGVAGLGTVRDQLAQEADSLWARRRANDRAYYAASDELARADAALKAATVRTKDWVQAQEHVLSLDARRQALAQQVHALEAERLQLERVRRVAPALTQWREHQTALAPLKHAVLLPEHAAAQLAQTELTLATAGREQTLLDAQAQALAAQLAGLWVDDGVLKHQADIQALAARRQQVQHHARDIERCRLELAAHTQQLQGLLRQLAWPVGDDGLPATPLPSLPARAALADLARQHAVLQQADQAAAALLADKAAECQALQAQMDAVLAPAARPAPGLNVAAAVPAALRAALAEARALGDVAQVLAREQAQVDRCQRELTAATQALGRWAADAPRLRQQVLPSPQDLAQRLQSLADAQAACHALADRQAELARAVAAQALLVTQYRHAHHPVTWGDVQQARTQRDALWAAVKTGAQPVPAVAAQLDDHIAAADRVADQRHDKAQAESELQARQDALERLQQQADQASAQRAAQEAHCGALRADWDAVAGAAGLDGLPLHDAPAWCAARAEALRAADALAGAQHTLQSTQLQVAQASAALHTALAGAGHPAPASAPWPVLVLLAGDVVDAATATQARLHELQKQQALAGPALARLQDQAHAAHAAWLGWQAAWQGATAAVGLAADTSVTAAEGALVLMASTDLKLREMQDLRHARIDTMQRDLDDFEQDVAAVVARLGPAAQALAPLPASDAVVELSARLAQALAAQQEAQRLQRETQACQAQAQAAGARVAQAQATLQPLQQQAGVADVEALRQAIALSDQRRSLEAAASTAYQAVLAGGDGSTLGALQAELESSHPAQAALRVQEIGHELAALRPLQDALTAQHTEASAVLARMAGGADAARAESDRQDALAKMANAAERYIQVHTAQRLLKWAIDRYRETRQGPMLQRAGQIFSALTLGSFTRLSVDFDSEPLALTGQRESGPPVGVAGMSEGTRDQLYLALRLAALELQLAQGHALPFIADDLFINYDDGRAQAGLQALADLSQHTQVIFLSHHEHLLPAARAVFGPALNVLRL